MLSRPNRLAKRKDFDVLFKKGVSTASKTLILKYLKTTEASPTRIAFVISNKTEKSAIKRNRVRRQLREITRLLLPSFSTGYDMIFLVKPSFKESEFSEKTKEVKHLLAKAGMLE